MLENTNIIKKNYVNHRKIYECLKEINFIFHKLNFSFNKLIENIALQELSFNFLHMYEQDCDIYTPSLYYF